VPLSEVIEDDPDEERPSFKRQDKAALRYPLPKNRTCIACSKDNHDLCTASWCICKQEGHEQPFPP
jgi:hypothetical protein